MLLLEAHVTLIFFSFNGKQRIAPSLRKTTPSHGWSCERLLACGLAVLRIDSILVRCPFPKWNLIVLWLPGGATWQVPSNWATLSVCHRLPQTSRWPALIYCRFKLNCAAHILRSQTGVYKGILAYRKKINRMFLCWEAYFLLVSDLKIIYFIWLRMGLAG